MKTLKELLIEDEKVINAGFKTEYDVVKKFLSQCHSCRDCKFSEPYYDNIGYLCSEYDLSRNAEDFCSNFIPKED